MGFCFLFILVPLCAPFGSEQTWVAGLPFFSSLHPKDSGVLVTFDDTLVFNDCIMEWVNIPSKWDSVGVRGIGGSTMQSPGQMGRG
jgi:hypothetical protein